MTAYLKKRYLCHPCKRSYRNPEDHICKNIYKSCYRLDCEKQFSFPCQCCQVLKEIWHVSRFTMKLIANNHFVSIYVVIIDNGAVIVRIQLIWIINFYKKCIGFIFFDFEAYADQVTGEHNVNLAMAKKFV